MEQLELPFMEKSVRTDGEQCRGDACPDKDTCACRSRAEITKPVSVDLEHPAPDDEQVRQFHEDYNAFVKHLQRFAQSQFHTDAAPIELSLLCMVCATATMNEYLDPTQTRDCLNAMVLDNGEVALPMFYRKFLFGGIDEEVTQVAACQG